MRQRRNGAGCQPGCTATVDIVRYNWNPGTRTPDQSLRPDGWIPGSTGTRRAATQRRLRALAIARGFRPRRAQSNIRQTSVCWRGSRRSRRRLLRHQVSTSSGSSARCRPRAASSVGRECPSPCSRCSSVRLRSDDRRRARRHPPDTCARTSPQRRPECPSRR